MKTSSMVTSEYDEYGDGEHYALPVVSMVSMAPISLRLLIAPPSLVTSPMGRLPVLGWTTLYWWTLLYW